MQSQLRTTMKGAISNVLETMFFLVPTFEDNENSQTFENTSFLLESSIAITNKNEHLKLHFMVSRDFSSIITGNFLGVGQEQVSLEQMEDTLKELANMIGGDCLARLPANNWELGIPKLEPLETAQDAQSGRNICVVAFSWNDEPKELIHLSIDQ
jgi:hypothetical protein